MSDDLTPDGVMSKLEEQSDSYATNEVISTTSSLSQQMLRTCRVLKLNLGKLHCRGGEFLEAFLNKELSFAESAETSFEQDEGRERRNSGDFHAWNVNVTPTKLPPGTGTKSHHGDYFKASRSTVGGGKEGGSTPRDAPSTWDSIEADENLRNIVRQVHSPIVCPITLHLMDIAISIITVDENTPPGTFMNDLLRMASPTSNANWSSSRPAQDISSPGTPDQNRATESEINEKTRKLSHSSMGSKIRMSIKAKPGSEVWLVTTTPWAISSVVSFSNVPAYPQTTDLRIDAFSAPLNIAVSLQVVL